MNIDEKKPNNIASTKIIELSKKNRQLKAELESTKSKYSKIDAKLDKLEKEIAQNDFKKSLDSKLKKVRFKLNNDIGITINIKRFFFC